MDVPQKANDGKSNRALFSGRAGDFRQQVVLCSDWCALEVLPNPSTHTEGQTRKSVVSEYWKAECIERCLLGLDGGKERKLLPIRIILQITR